MKQSGRGAKELQPASAREYSSVLAAANCNWPFYINKCRLCVVVAYRCRVVLAGQQLALEANEKELARSELRRTSVTRSCGPHTVQHRL